MIRLLTIAIFASFIGSAAEAFNFDLAPHAASNLRAEAAEMLRVGRKDTAEMLLGKAWGETANIKNKGERVDAMAAIAADEAKLGKLDDARAHFAEALAVTGDIGNAEFTFKKMMVIMQAQKDTGDAEGTRATGLAIIEKGMLERMARKKVRGVGRFMETMDGVLGPGDVAQLMERVGKMKSAPYRRFVMEGLVHMDYASADIADTAINKAQQGVAQHANRMEQLLWGLASARLYLASGDVDMARTLLDRAGQEASAMANGRDDAVRMVDAMRERLPRRR